LPETAGVLVNLLSGAPDPALFADPSAWGLIKEKAVPAGVAALIAHIARPHLPPAEQAWCDRVLTQSWARHEQSLHDLNGILGVLESESIRTLALKGPLLARRSYDPPFLRKPSIDLDLAIRECDLDRACGALAREGYRLEESLRRAKMLSHHAVLSHPSKRRVELHFRLSHRSSGIRVEQLFARAVPYELPGGRMAWVPGPADEMLHLILHTVSDRFALLFHLYEVRLIWQALPPGVQRETVRRGAENHFAGALRMVDIVFRSLWGDGILTSDMELPRTWLHWRLNEKLYRSCEAWWGPDPPLRRMSGLHGRWLDFQTTDRPANAARFLSNAAFTAWFQLRMRSAARTLNRTSRCA
jgi:hypothetical protein